MVFTSWLAVTPTVNYTDRYLNGCPLDCSFISCLQARLLTVSGLDSSAAQAHWNSSATVLKSELTGWCSTWTTPTVPHGLFVSESSKRTCRPENCTKMGSEFHCRASHFRFVPFCYRTRASWLVGRSCVNEFGPKTRCRL